MTLIRRTSMAALAMTMALCTASAETALTVSVPLPPDCASRTDVIGLSRIVEIDTTGGPKFGHSHYKDVDFLADGEVVLTFDDGPMRRYTKPILDILDRQCTRATFFSVGKMALSDPEMLKETARRGHTVASHTWSHKKLSSLSAEQAKTEIELGLSAVTLALGAPVAPFFRFPYLRDSKAALAHLASRNMSTFSIEVDSEDFRSRNPGAVLRQVMSQLKVAKKGIILFHDIQPSTAGALSKLLEDMHKHGFKIVHLVAKSASTTLPEFDVMAKREAAKKYPAIANQSGGGLALPETASGPNPKGNPSAVPKGTQPTATIATGTTDPVSLPWTAPQEGTGSNDVPASEAPPVAYSPPALKRRPLWQMDDDPWRIRLPGE